MVSDLTLRTGWKVSGIGRARLWLLEERGLTLVEILVAIVLFGLVAVFLLYTFLSGMRFTARANELSAATTIATQVLEQIRASPNPDAWPILPRTPVPLPSPYDRVRTIEPYDFDVEVTRYRDDPLSLFTYTVRVWRHGASGGAQPLAELQTVVDDR